MTRKDFEPGPLAQVSREMGEGEATLIFRRTLRHPPGKVWRALTRPDQQREWLPFVADRDIGTVGVFMLTMTDHEGAEPTEAEVLRAEPERLLSYRWGDDVLTWALEPAGSGTRLTLRHLTRMADHIASFAAGWHICIDVMDRYLSGRPVGAIVGEEAMQYGWAPLLADYEKMLRAQGHG